MAIQKGERFKIEFGQAFPKGLVLVGEVDAATEYQSQEDRSRGRAPSQRVDERTGKRVWKAVATDPDEGRAKRASFDVFFLSDVQPVPRLRRCCRGCARSRSMGWRSSRR